MAPLAFTLPLLLFIAFAFAQDPIHIPLTRRSRVLRAFNPAEEANRLRFKYGLAGEATPVRRGSPDRRASSVGVPIINQNMDTSYLGTITVGTPPQTFNVSLDTGSSDLWLVDASCLGCLSSAPRYQPSLSTSFQGTGKQGNSSLGQNVAVPYLQGNIAGVTVADTVTMGGLKISSQTFLSAYQVSRGLLNGSTSGLMGLAFTSIAETNATPFWEALVNNNQLSSPEMSFWLNRSTDAQDIEVPGGMFTLGGTSSSLFTGDIEFFNITVSSTLGPIFWLLSMSAVSVGGQSVKTGTGTSALASIDTGTTLIGGPTANVKAIWEAVPGATPSQEFAGYFEFPCTTVVNISLSFGGKLWPISSQDMNLGPVSQNGFCLGAIVDVNTALNITNVFPPWIIGDTFLKNVYSVFRASPGPSVGFAQLSNLTDAGANSAAGPKSTAGANPTVSTKSAVSTGSSNAHNGSPPRHSPTIFVLLASGLLSSIAMLAL